ncbi:Formate hydrogenlyase transcriptional activator [Thalassoglobus neptunius]|uniref:Formate hydrogenlyase transcriptional activator n=1 Tax=Thalassoglobus neptunius TaxID=1938619 RepID=A0A5C5X5R7_9PLAN|nr:sigma 54-interacting transcriptional regulator [Thalassoglobus neptunius]TWT57671.1 Formate hydrogenlyase transcriptional activator [Thalassoglobus neptunius]
MNPSEIRPPNINLLKQLLLDMAQARGVQQVLKLVVDRMASQPEVALARIWLLGPGDLCANCHLRHECEDQSVCLHLVASSGSSKITGEEWTGLDGVFRRFPFGVRKVGRIAATGQPLEVPDIAEHPEILARPDWAEAEGIRALGGQPLVHKGEVLGVLAIFTRACLGEENLTWMRTIADHAAAAIANARAFEEITRLKEQLELERDYLREELAGIQEFGDIIGQSPSLMNVLQQIDLVAATDASVLILGESGTGKELVAREIHRRSQRHERSMVKCNCASIPRELYESEFFGHAKGAFTGAISDRAGRFQLADGGTLFLDEVGEIPLDMQSKLLRVLQEGEFERVGEERTQRVDVRIVAATNRDLKQEIEAKRFREDLYYRLNVFPIQISPLRERKEDISVLAAQFVDVSARNLNRTPPRLTQGNILQLQRYDWPGNIRELQNVIERAVITSVKGRLRFELPGVERGKRSDIAETSTSIESSSDPQIVTEDEMRRRERENIIAALKQTRWKISGEGGAADLLGIKPTTLTSRMKKMGIERPV